jgi:predicted alpha/beta-fold hydrolase
MESEPPRFRTPAWLTGPHAQTIVGRAARSRSRFDYVRRRIDTPDGDFLDLDGTGSLRDAPIVLVLHGLEGSSRSGYVAQTCALLADAGANPIAMNFRSCSGEPNRCLRSYHSGETTDLGHVVSLLRDENPGLQIGAIGYSLGGNTLLCYLAESDQGLDAAVAVSVPYDLAASARKLEVGMGRVYTRYFLGTLRSKIQEKAGRLPEAARLAPAALAARTIRGIDEAWTAPVHGYIDADDYYEKCSSLAGLDRIGTPTLLVQAEDDPFLPANTAGDVRAIGNPFLIDGFTRRGGHLGYLAAGSTHRLWAEARATNWLMSQLENLNGGPEA